jgi:curved DNA-binding protein CbpA
MNYNYINKTNISRGSVTEAESSVKVNPFRLFSLPEPNIGTFTRTELKNSMRKLVLITHPDKPTGSDKKFKIVSECYKYLSSICDENEKTTRELKNVSIDETRILRESEEVSIPATNYKRFTSGTSGNSNNKGFDLKGFNDFFEENRIDEPLTRGHGDWLKSTDEDAEKRSLKRVSEGKFQEAFEEERQRLLREKRMVVYKGVQPLLSSSKLSGVSLATGSLYEDDDVGAIKIGRGGVDVRRAHEIGVIEVQADETLSNKINQRVSVESARMQRETARLAFTDEERRENEKIENENKMKQEKLLEKIQSRKQQIEDHYRKVNMLLKN